MTPFREEVMRAADLVKKNVKTFAYIFKDSPTEGTVKQRIIKDQHKPARELALLMGQLETLNALESERANEKSKRWQANYDYVVAKLLAHVAYAYEYNFMLGQIRKDALPPRKGEGWQLASSPTMQSGSEGKKLAAEAMAVLEKWADAAPGPRPG